jgi:hypothetical protein
MATAEEQAAWVQARSYLQGAEQAVTLAQGAYERVSRDDGDLAAILDNITTVIGDLDADLAEAQAALEHRPGEP